MKVVSVCFTVLLMGMLFWGLGLAPGVSADPQDPYKGGLLSLKGQKWEIGGYLETEFVHTQNEPGFTSNPYSHFQIDQLYLVPKITYDKVTLYAEIAFFPDTTILEEAHVTFTGLPGNTFIKVGLDDRFIKRSRITETYPLVGSAFWRDDDLGIFAGGKFPSLYWFLSFTNGLRVGSSATSVATVNVAEDSGFKIMQEDRNTTDLNENKELGIGLGRKQNLKKYGEADIFLFAYFGGLSKTDIAALKTIPKYTSSENEKNFWGFRLTHKWKSAQLVGEYIESQTGDITRTGWYIEPSYKAKTPWKKPSSVIFLYRYNTLENNLPLTATKAGMLTWDWRVNTVASVIELQKYVNLKLEYNLIDENRVGGKEVNNDEFLAQLEVIF